VEEEGLTSLFFSLSKILGFFALPSNLIITCGIVGALLLRTRYGRAGWRMVIGSLIALSIAGFSPLGNALVLGLEDRFPAWDSSRGTPDGIVVLGGAVTPDVSAARGTPALNEAAERMTAAVELARRYPQARILFTGGSGSLVRAEFGEAEHALRLFEALGIARDRVLIEDRARNTFENAVFSKAVAAPKPGERWLLVTSAYHMPRSVGVFRQAGFPIEPHPVDWRTVGRGDLYMPFGSLTGGLARLDVGLKEYVGLLAYWVTGKSSELLPGPSTTSPSAGNANR
jgi:uncharacterized SAM-binding protein YcdF (DUF218 family)